MTAIGVESGVDVIERLDFEESKACEWEEPECSREAVVLVLHNCCGYSYLACAGHVEELRNWFQMIARRKGAFAVCQMCERRDISCPSFLPLKGGA